MSNLCISSPKKTTQILNKYGISLKKSLGQNFLIDANIARKIIFFANLGLDDTVLEVGCGIGSLTEIILSRVKKIVCIEIDSLLIKAFKDIFGDDIGSKIELINADALKLDYEKIATKYNINKVVSNLPYKISAPLILKILIEADKIKNFIITIQKDIADRIVSKVGDKNYSSYTVKANFLAEFEICFLISKNCFIPKPHVDSAVVKITTKDREKLFNKIYGMKIYSYHKEVLVDFFNFINSSFLHRRKKLINSLIKSNLIYAKRKNEIFNLLSKIGKDKNVRAENLSLENYIFLYNNIFINK